MLQWNSSLSVGVDWIDKQHKDLIQNINKLLKAMSQGQGEKEITPIMQFLETYIQDHFKDEADIMKRHSYPQTQAHLQQHQEFTNRFKEVEKKYREQGISVPLTLEVQNWMSQWLVNHINKVDKELGKFLQSKGYN